MTSRVDASDLGGMQALIDEIDARHGRLDGVFANAGAGLFKDIDGTEKEDFDRGVDVNLKACSSRSRSRFRCCAG